MEKYSFPAFWRGTSLISNEAKGTTESSEIAFESFCGI